MSTTEQTQQAQGLPSGTWATDPVHSEIGFSVDYMAGTFRGTFSNFEARLDGGAIEGSAEVRFPIWKNLGGAAFVDGAIVGESTLRGVTGRTGALTPGVGVRYYSPVGPIRVDVGFNPNVSEPLRVLTQVGDGAISEIVPVQIMGTDGSPIDVTRNYAPAKNRGGFRGFLNQLTLHLSIGHAY